MTVLLRFESVTLRRAGRVLFENLDLRVDTGQALQASGPNGSGKSSLIRLAAGLLNADKGRVERSPCALADDNVALDRELSLRRALQFWIPSPDEAMDALGLSSLAEVPVRLLSSGQLKRATLARVAGSRAALWLLDEPMNALDADGTRLLSHLIARHLATGGSVVAASHQKLAGSWASVELGR